MNTNHKLYRKLEDEIHDSMYDYISDGFHEAYICFDDAAYVLEISVKENGDVLVDIDTDHPERKHPNIREAIALATPEWSDVSDEWERDNREYDEWEEHGFRDEADYYHWRYG